MAQKFKILQLNICGASSRSNMCMENYIDKEMADLVFLSEVKTDDPIHFSNYVSCCKPNRLSPNSKGGVSLSARLPLDIERQTWLENRDVDAIFAVITIKSLRILVSSVNIPPK